MNELKKAYIEYIIDTIKPHIDRSSALGPIQYCSSTSLNNSLAHSNDQSITDIANNLSLNQNKPDDSLGSGSLPNYGGTSTANAYGNNQSGLVVPNLVSIGQGRLDLFTDEELDQYLNSIPSPGSTSAHDYFLASGALPNFDNTTAANSHANKQHTTVAPNQSFIAQVQTDYSGAVSGDPYYDNYTGLYRPLVNTTFDSHNNIFTSNLLESSQYQAAGQNPEDFSNDPNVQFSPSTFISTPDQQYFDNLHYEPSDGY